MKILPVPPLKQLLIKVLVPLSLSVTSLIITVLALGIGKKISWLTLIFALVLTLILLVIFDIVSLKEEMRIGNNRPRSTAMSTLYSYLLPVAFFASAVVSCIFGMDIRWAYVIGLAVFALLGAPHLIKLRSRMKEMFLDLEMVN